MVQNLLITIALLVPMDAPQLLTKSAFEKGLDHPVTATRTGISIRECLSDFSHEYQMAIHLDRRIDPGSLINVQWNRTWTDDAIRQLAHQVNADISVVADTVVIAPVESAAKLRTRILLVQEQLNDVAKSDAQRRLELNRRRLISWDELSTPREILTGIASRSKVSIENLDAVPHDLWATGSIAYANTSEALVLILHQFDLEPKWLSGNSIRIVPATAEPMISESHLLKGTTRAAVEEAVQERFPDLKATWSGKKMTFRGLVEEHEAVAVLTGERRERKRSTTSETPVPLSRRRFTLKMVRQPFLGLMGVLQKQGFKVEFDAQAFQAAGIDLEQKVSLEFKDATLEELLQAGCSEVGCSFELVPTDAGLPSIMLIAQPMSED